MNPENEIPKPPRPITPGAMTSHVDRQKHLAALRTFSSDLADAIRQKGGSVVRVAIAEEEKHRREYEETSIRSKKNMFFTFAGVFCILAAIIAVVYGYEYKQKKDTPVVVTTTRAASIISTDDDTFINTSGMQIPDLIAAVQASVANSGMQSGTMNHIVLAKSAGGLSAPELPARELLAALDTHAPESFLRVLSNEYMLGVYRYQSSTNLFLILRGTAHDFLLAGMHAWEPDIFADLSSFLGVDTSAMTRAQIESATFTDALIANHETRAILSADKKPIFFYSFLDQDTIVFTTDPKTLAEVVQRF